MSAGMAPDSRSSPPFPTRVPVAAARSAQSPECWRSLQPFSRTVAFALRVRILPRWRAERAIELLSDFPPLLSFSVFSLTAGARPGRSRAMRLSPRHARVPPLPSPFSSVSDPSFRPIDALPDLSSPRVRSNENDNEWSGAPRRAARTTPAEVHGSEGGGRRAGRRSRFERAGCEKTPAVRKGETQEDARGPEERSAGRCLRWTGKRFRRRGAAAAGGKSGEENEKKTQARSKRSGTLRTQRGGATGMKRPGGLARAGWRQRGRRARRKKRRRRGTACASPWLRPSTRSRP